MQRLLGLFFLAVLTGACVAPCQSQERSAPDSELGSDSEEVAIRQAIDAYVLAFNRRDAEALAAHWSPGAVYTSRQSGEQFVGREAISELFGDILSSEQAPHLEVTTESIQFVSPNVALERGTATSHSGCAW